MDPIIGGALIKGGLGLLGGLFGQRSRRKQAARQEYLRSPAGIRAESEKAGFNPLTVLQSGRDFAADLYRPVIGDALANAGMAVGDGMQQAAMEKTRLQMHNDNLKARLKALSLKPVPNQYGRTTGTGAKIGRQWQGPIAPLDKIDRVEVWLPWADGKNMPATIPLSSAQRLGINRGDILMAGDVTELVGEIYGEGGVVINPEAISENMTGGQLFFADKVQNNSAAVRRNTRRFMPAVTGQTPSRGSIGRTN